MPSPFPGMDPYLEGSEWMSVHGQLVAEIARQLAPLIRPKYVALMQKRFVIDDSADGGGLGIEARVPSPRVHTYPDVAVHESNVATAAEMPGMAAASPTLELATLMPASVPQHSVEIRDVAERTLVTAIELLSPANKRGGGHRQYVRRRNRLLHSSAHLLEIDLLRTGRRVPRNRPLPDHPYFVFLSRVRRRAITEIWPISLEQSLPSVPVPLLSGDPDAALDLQRALTSVYDLLGYDLMIDYGRPPDLPLEGESGAWARELIEARGSW